VVNACLVSATSNPGTTKTKQKKSDWHLWHVSALARPPELPDGAPLGTAWPCTTRPHPSPSQESAPMWEMK
jgi:hypothetical protein